MSVSRTDWKFNGPCYLKSKISPQKEIIEYMSFHLIESSVLKVTKVKFSSLIWKIRHFKGQFLVSVSPIAKPFPQFTPFFIEAGLPKTISDNTAQQNQLLQPPVQLLADQEHYQQSGSLLACKQHKQTAKKCKNTSNFTTSPPPGI